MSVCMNRLAYNATLALYASLLNSSFLVSTSTGRQALQSPSVAPIKTNKEALSHLSIQLP